MDSAPTLVSLSPLEGWSARGLEAPVPPHRACSVHCLRHCVLVAVRSKNSRACSCSCAGVLTPSTAAEACSKAYGHNVPQSPNTNFFRRHFAASHSQVLAAVSLCQRLLLND